MGRLGAGSLENGGWETKPLVFFANTETSSLMFKIVRASGTSRVTKTPHRYFDINLFNVFQSGVELQWIQTCTISALTDYHASSDVNVYKSPVQTSGLQSGESAFLLHRRPLRVFQQRSRYFPGGVVQAELPASGTFSSFPALPLKVCVKWKNRSVNECLGHRRK